MGVITEPARGPARSLCAARGRAAGRGPSPPRRPEPRLRPARPGNSRGRAVVLRFDFSGLGDSRAGGSCALRGAVRGRDAGRHGCPAARGGVAPVRGRRPLLGGRHRPARGPSGRRADPAIALVEPVSAARPGHVLDSYRDRHLRPRSWLRLLSGRSELWSELGGLILRARLRRRRPESPSRPAGGPVGAAEAGPAAAPATESPGRQMRRFVEGRGGSLPRLLRLQSGPLPLREGPGPRARGLVRRPCACSWCRRPTTCSRRSRRRLASWTPSAPGPISAAGDPAQGRSVLPRRDQSCDPVRKSTRAVQPVRSVRERASATSSCRSTWRCRASVARFSGGVEGAATARRRSYGLVRSVLTLKISRPAARGRELVRTRRRRRARSPDGGEVAELEGGGAGADLRDDLGDEVGVRVVRAEDVERRPTMEAAPVSRWKRRRSSSAMTFVWP